MVAQLTIDPTAIRHAVQFYANDDELVGSVAGYIRLSLLAGGSAVVIATPSHVRGFQTRLADSGVNPARASEDGTLMTLDAAETLSRFMVDGRPNAVAFDEVVGEPLRRLRRAGTHPAAYGEMVALLWEAGNVAGALELEELWNRLLEETEFSLLCAYPASVAGGSADAFRSICGLHSAVVGGPMNVMAPQSQEPVEVSEVFQLSDKAPRAARLFTAEVLHSWGRRTVIDEAVTVVGELASNAIRHAQSDFTLTIASRDHTIRISVRDKSSAPLPAVPDATGAGSSYGLFLIDALASNWGTQISEQGKVVWAELHVGGSHGDV